MRATPGDTQAGRTPSRAHVDPHEAVALHCAAGLRVHFVLEILMRRHVRHVDHKHGVSD